MLSLALFCYTECHCAERTVLSVVEQKFVHQIQQKAFFEDYSTFSTQHNGLICDSEHNDAQHKHRVTLISML